LKGVVHVVFKDTISAAKCVDCADWFGCCHAGSREKKLRYNYLASSEACSDFKPKKPKGQT
jgi:hypothetical protein